MVVHVSATIWYACYLDEEQQKQVKDYVNEHDVNLRESVIDLCSDINTDFKLYKDSHESDFMKKEIIDVEED